MFEFEADHPLGKAAHFRTQGLAIAFVRGVLGLDHGAAAHARTRTRKVIVDPEAPARNKRTPSKKPPYNGKSIEGATQKQNGKWRNHSMFPGRVFHDLDEYRAAKKQRAEQRAAYSDQLYAWAHGRY